MFLSRNSAVVHSCSRATCAILPGDDPPSTHPKPVVSTRTEFPPARLVLAALFWRVPPRSPIAPSISRGSILATTLSLKRFSTPSTCCKPRYSLASLQPANVLHDIGQLPHHWPKLLADQGVDTHHEEPSPRKETYWPFASVPRWSIPSALHDSTKRWLLALVELSPVSVQSLASKGGPFSREEVRSFESPICKRAAVALRRWNDQAKVEGLPTLDLEHYHSILDAGNVNPQ